MKTQYPSNIILHTSNSYNGYPVQVRYQPLILNILQINEKVLMSALSNHKRTCGMRFDLKVPINSRGKDFIISKFIDSLRARIKSDLDQKNRRKGQIQKCKLSYLWVCELSSNNNWHYHVIIFVNNDVYNCLGYLTARSGNMYSRIKAAWASALSLDYNDASGLVHIPKNAIYKVDSRSVGYEQQVFDVLYRISYFAKAQTKPFGLSTNHRFVGHSAI